jgi:hypothetical protein
VVLLEGADSVEEMTKGEEMQVELILEEVVVWAVEDLDLQHKRKGRPSVLLVSTVQLGETLQVNSNLFYSKRCSHSCVSIIGMQPVFLVLYC